MIIIITKKNIILFDKEENEYKIKKEYLIHDTWKIKVISSRKRFYGDYHQYYYSYILPNIKLLLNLFSIEKSYNGGSTTNPPYKLSYSKIYRPE